MCNVWTEARANFSASILKRFVRRKATPILAIHIIPLIKLGRAIAFRPEKNFDKFLATNYIYERCRYVVANKKYNKNNMSGPETMPLYFFD